MWHWHFCWEKRSDGELLFLPLCKRDFRPVPNFPEEIDKLILFGIRQILQDG